MEAAIKGLSNLFLSEHEIRILHQFNSSETFCTVSTLHYKDFEVPRHKRPLIDYQNVGNLEFILEKYMITNLELWNNFNTNLEYFFQRWLI